MSNINIMQTHAKEISITVCDDWLPYEEPLHDTEKRIYRKKYVYYGSCIITVLFITTIFYWSYLIIITDIASALH
jgi:hypothetical protein